MKTPFLPRSAALALALLCCGIGPSKAQEKIASLGEIKSQAELDQAVTAMDTQLFNAYNTCNIGWRSVSMDFSKQSRTTAAER